MPSADRSKSIVEVRVSILDADANVKPEMTASVTFQEREAPKADAAAAAPAAPVVLVSRRAVIERDGQAVVWVVTGNTAARRTVTLGAERLDQVEVRNGLAPGEAVVISPPALTDGVRVRIKQ
jgi:hypothetical protein